MTLFFTRANRDLGDTPNNLIPSRVTPVGTVNVTASTALRSSAVWACARLRADLLSTLPIKLTRAAKLPDGGSIDIDQPLTPFLTDPANDGFGICDWLYSSQVDLDRSGNAVGIVRARDGLGLPAVVELVDLDHVTVIGKGATITGYRISGVEYDPRDIWHERAFTVPGVPLGLSPIAHAALSIGTHQSAQRFAVDWFANNATPSGRLKNTARKIQPAEAETAKSRFKAAVANRDIFVHGADWEYDAITITANESQFLETMQFSINDIGRFYGVPGDLIDAPSMSSAHITYANITQRHLSLLILNLNPTVVRRERALSSATAKPRRVSFDTDALLRMDPQTLATVLGTKITSRQLAPSEAREQLGRLPYTDDQLAEFDRLFGKGQPAPGKTEGVPA